MGTAIRKHLGDFAAILAIFAVAIGVAGYILVNQDARPSFPLIERAPRLWPSGHSRFVPSSTA